MASTPTEKITGLQMDFGMLRERVEALSREIKELNDQRRLITIELKEIREYAARLNQDNAVLKQIVQDHIAQYQEWDRRRWGMITLLIGAILSLAAGLIVTLARKSP